MLGGGSFMTMNKKLNGAYINFVSATQSRANLGDRGVVAVVTNLGWGEVNALKTYTVEELVKNSLNIFGTSWGDISDGVSALFYDLVNSGATTVHIVNVGDETDEDSVPAESTIGEARYVGHMGNNIKVVSSVNADDTSKFDVKTIVGGTVVDTQTVSSASALVDNDFVIFKSSATLSATTYTFSDGDIAIAKLTDYTNALELLEDVNFNVLWLPTIEPLSYESSLKNVVIAYTKRMRTEVGKKFQYLLTSSSVDSGVDDEGVVSLYLGNISTETSRSLEMYKAILEGWVAGKLASCPINKSLLNLEYKGYCPVTAPMTKAQTETAMDGDCFAFHNVNGVMKVLADRNTLVTTSSDKDAEIFKENQTIRVIDQIATDIAKLFNEKYLGIIPNDAGGRISLWNDIVKHHKVLADMRAIEDFAPEDVVVEKGETKNSVIVSDAITVVNAMAKLYMTVHIA